MKKAFIGFGMLVVCVVCVLCWVKLFNRPTATTSPCIINIVNRDTHGNMECISLSLTDYNDISSYTVHYTVNDDFTRTGIVDDIKFNEMYTYINQFCVITEKHRNATGSSVHDFAVGEWDYNTGRPTGIGNKYINIFYYPNVDDPNYTYVFEGYITVSDPDFDMIFNKAKEIGKTLPIEAGSISVKTNYPGYGFYQTYSLHDVGHGQFGFDWGESEGFQKCSGTIKENRAKKIIDYLNTLTYSDGHTVAKFHSSGYNDKGVLVENERPERYIIVCGDTYIIDNDALNWLICEGFSIMSDISDSVKYDE